MILASLACTPRAIPPGGERPDVVLVSIDTLRADHLGCYGHSRDTSPFIDGLAATGTRFAHARSPSPWTLPSHATLLSGSTPLEHGVVDDGRAIPDELALIQETFRSGGFTTVGVVSTFFVSARFGFDRGFDVWEDFEVHDKKTNRQSTVDAEDVVDALMRSLPAGQEAFVFLHLYDAHYPYAAPGGYDTLFDRAATDGDLAYKQYHHYLEHPVEADQMAHQVAQYDEEIRYVDDQLRRLHESFSAAGRPVIFVVTSDHGEEFGERGSWGHAHTLHPEQLHVPLVIHGPGVGVAVVEDVVGTQDIAATLASLAGLERQGQVLIGEDIPARSFLSDTSRFDTNRLGIYREGARLDWDLSSSKRTLYGDPAELVELDDPETAARLEAELRDRLPRTHLATGEVRTSAWTHPASPSEGASFALLPPDAEVEGARPLGFAERAVTLGAEGKKRLEALGYLQ